MTEANQPMSRAERVAALLLASILVALVLNRGPRPRYDRATTAWTRPIPQADCLRVHSCIDRETYVLQQLLDCVRSTDRQCIASMERDLVDTREALARFSAEDDVPLDGELDSHGSRANAMEALANEYARLSPAERHAIEARY